MRKRGPYAANACRQCAKGKRKCDGNRPCERCVRLGTEEFCIDVVHLARGRNAKKKNALLNLPQAPKRSVGRPPGPRKSASGAPPRPTRTRRSRRSARAGVKAATAAAAAPIDPTRSAEYEAPVVPRRTVVARRRRARKPESDRDSAGSLDDMFGDRGSVGGNSSGSELSLGLLAAANDQRARDRGESPMAALSVGSFGSRGSGGSIAAPVGMGFNFARVRGGLSAGDAAAEERLEYCAPVGVGYGPAGMGIPMIASEIYGGAPYGPPGLYAMQFGGTTMTPIGAVMDPSLPPQEHPHHPIPIGAPHARPPPMPQYAIGATLSAPQDAEFHQGISMSPPTHPEVPTKAVGSAASVHSARASSPSSFPSSSSSASSAPSSHPPASSSHPTHMGMTGGSADGKESVGASIAPPPPPPMPYHVLAYPTEGGPPVYVPSPYMYPPHLHAMEHPSSVAYPPHAISLGEKRSYDSMQALSSPPLPSSSPPLPHSHPTPDIELPRPKPKRRRAEGEGEVGEEEEEDSDTTMPTVVSATHTIASATSGATGLSSSSSSSSSSSATSLPHPRHTSPPPRAISQTVSTSTPDEPHKTPATSTGEEGTAPAPSAAAQSSTESVTSG